MLSRGGNECTSYDEWYPLNTHFGQCGHTKLEVVSLYKTSMLVLKRLQYRQRLFSCLG